MQKQEAEKNAEDFCREFELPDSGCDWAEGNRITHTIHMMRKMRIFWAAECVDCVQKQGERRIFCTCIAYCYMRMMRNFWK
jgi:hypothetical protein